MICLLPDLESNIENYYIRPMISLLYTEDLQLMERILLAVKMTAF